MDVRELHELKPLERLRKIGNPRDMAPHVRHPDAFAHACGSKAEARHPKREGRPAVLLNGRVESFARPARKDRDEDHRLAGGREEREKEKRRLAEVARDEHPPRKLGRDEAAEEERRGARKERREDDDARERGLRAPAGPEGQDEPPEHPGGHDQMKDGEAHVG